MKKISIYPIALCLLSGCAASTTKDQPQEPHIIGMPNPASKYCVDIGGSLEIVKTEKGSLGICTLPDGTKIEEWELFRKDHPQK